MPINKKYQIFVSSTFEDLEEERRLVIEQILNMGHIPVGMELFQASDDEQWEYIRRRIDQCDYYLVIVAQRYGACASDGLSFTEKEYRYARDHKIPVAALLLSTKAQKTWPSGKVQADHAAKLEKFRTFCATKKMVKYWDDPKDLALKAIHALNGLISDHPRPGLISASEAASSGTIAELARLSEENNQLRQELADLGSETLSARETAMLKTLETTALSKVLANRGIQELNPTNDSDACELFYDIASGGTVAITGEHTGKLLAVRLAIKANEDNKTKLGALGFVMNDRFCALGLLTRDSSAATPTWTVSDLGWVVIRESLSPEDILLRW